MQISRLVAVVAVLGACWLHPGSAWGLDENAARQHFERATDSFTKGRYDEAVREYLLAYRASNDPSLLFNVAQSHRLAGHYSSALQYYRMYLQNTPDASDRKEVEKQIREMEKKLGLPSEPEGMQKLTPPPPKPVPPPKAIVQPPPEPPPAPEPPRVTEPPPVAPPPSAPPATGETSPYAGRAKIIAGGVTLGVGVALVATGIAFGALAQQAGDQLTADNRAGRPFDPNKQSAGRADTIGEGVCLGIGAAAAVAGAVVLGVGVSEKRAARIAVVPTISTTGVAASVIGRF